MGIEVFARNSAGELILYEWTGVPPGRWRYANLTTDPNETDNTPGPLLAGDPVVVRNYPGRIDVFARTPASSSSPNWELAQYWRQPGYAQGRWQPVNLTIDPIATRIVPGLRIYTDPVVLSSYIDGAMRFDIFAVNGEGALIQYWWQAGYDGGKWQHTNLTLDPNATAEVPARYFAGRPVAYASRQDRSFRLDVYGRGINGDLIQYWWSQASERGLWRHGNLTTGQRDNQTVPDLTDDPPGLAGRLAFGGSPSALLAFT